MESAFAVVEILNLAANVAPLRMSNAKGFLSGALIKKDSELILRVAARVLISFVILLRILLQVPGVVVRLGSLHFLGAIKAA